MTACAIGIDVGGTTTKVGTTADPAGATPDVELPTPKDFAELVELISTQVALLRGVHGTDTPVGVVVPGIVDENTGTVVRSGNLGWTDVPARDIISAEIGSCVFGHDVRAGALAESRHREGRGDLLFVPIGTGIAAALVLNGEAWGSPWTGEIGQTLVPEPGSEDLVPLEQIASAAGLTRRYAAGSPSSLPVSGAQEVLERLEGGDAVAEKVFREAVDALGEVLAVCCLLLGPVPVVIGGGLSRAGDHLLTPLRARLKSRMNGMPVPDVSPAALGSWAGCRGAGLLALRAHERGGMTS